MRNKTAITLPSGKRIGHGHKVFLVAEIGNNHQGDPHIALRMIEEAARAGADAVKLQKRDMESLLTREGREAPYSGKNSFGRTYGEHRDALELSLESMAGLKAYAEGLGLAFFSSAWDLVSLEQMLDLGVELLKVCSADLVNVPLLRRAGASGLPVIMSTGMSSATEIDAAVEELASFHRNIVLLHCNSSYPCPDADICLPAMFSLRERYGLPVGYSGHERGLGPSVAAAALGACLIERHFTLDKTMRGTDHPASLEPAEFAALAGMIREVEASLSRRDKPVFPTEHATAAKLRKSIVAARDLPAGTVLTEDDLTVKSPGTGISPLYWDRIIGMCLSRDVARDEMLDWASVTEGAALSASI